MFPLPRRERDRVRVKFVPPKRKPKSSSKPARSGKSIIALTVKKILDEEIAKKLA